MPETQLLSFAQHAGPIRDRIDVALAKYAQIGSGCPDELREAIRYSVLAPGKRLRPMLALSAAEACGGTIDAAMPAACAVEMVHAYSLVHDDLPAMDDDDLRRGQPTCHKKYGEAVAILAGDALLSMAFELLAGQVQPPEVAAACCATLAEAAGPCGMVGGQADDIAASGGSPSETADTEGGGRLAALESLHARKTGALIRASLRLGALTANAHADQLAALDDYGRRLGLAFQITDDLLDVQSDWQTVGKRVGKDAQRGKLTFPGLLGVAESTRRAEALIDAACRALVSFGTRAAVLEALAQYVLERNR